MKTLDELLRGNIRALKPYSSARDEYNGTTASVFLDANESPFNSPYNRYPDPLQLQLKRHISKLKGVPVESIFLGNGSDEAIDLVFRAFCNPGSDNVVAIDPTYGMYKVCADINNVEYRRVELDKNFDFTAEALLSKCDSMTKVIFLCSPNNPTGNILNRQQIISTLMNFDGIVVLDEAYIDFSAFGGFTSQLADYPNLIILQTFSKAWGCAGIRLGMAFAAKEIIDVFNKIKYPYNINVLTANKALEMVQESHKVKGWINLLIEERTRMMFAFANMPICQRVYPSDANFFLAQMNNATAIYDYLVNKGIIVRNRSNIKLCENCLRITIGSISENEKLLQAINEYIEQR